MNISDMPAGRDLDALVAAAIKTPKIDVFGPVMICPPYSTAVGWWTETMLNWLASKHHDEYGNREFMLSFCSLGNGNSGWHASLDRLEAGDYWEATGDTVPLALSRLVALVGAAIARGEK